MDNTIILYPFAFINSIFFDEIHPFYFKKQSVYHLFAKYPDNTSIFHKDYPAQNLLDLQIARNGLCGVLCFCRISYSRNCRKSGVGGLWRREGRICGRYVFCLSLRLRLGKYASFQSMYSSTVILPLEQSSRLVRAAYFHFLKSGCLI